MDKNSSLTPTFSFVEVCSKDKLTKKDSYLLYLIQQSKLQVYHAPDINCNYHWTLGKKILKTLYCDYSRLIKYSNHFNNKKIIYHHRPMILNLLSSILTALKLIHNHIWNKLMVYGINFCHLPDYSQNSINHPSITSSAK